MKQISWFHKLKIIRQMASDQKIIRSLTMKSSHYTIGWDIKDHVE